MVVPSRDLGSNEEKEANDDISTCKTAMMTGIGLVMQVYIP